MSKRERSKGRHRPSVDPLECRFLLTAVSDLESAHPRAQTAAEFAVPTLTRTGLAHSARVSSSLAALALGRSDADETQDRDETASRAIAAAQRPETGVESTGELESAGGRYDSEVAPRGDSLLISVLSTSNSNDLKALPNIRASDEETGLGRGEAEDSSPRIAFVIEGERIASPKPFSRETSVPVVPPSTPPEPDDALLANPRGSEIISEFLPLDGASIDEAVDQFLAQIEELGAQLPPISETGEFLRDPVVWVIVVGALELTRRRIMNSDKEGRRSRRLPLSSGPTWLGRT
jgi:hypothetical protein